jgi:uncharacterized protein (DUF4415 family)
MACQIWHYNSGVPSKAVKTRDKKAQPRGRRVGRVFALASVEDELLGLAEKKPAGESRWNRPRKQRVTLRIDCEVVDWFKSKGPGYYTRMTRILRQVMVEGKKREGKG